MTIAILTATYNREKELSKLYESLVLNSQHIKNFTWYIMDDGSSDQTEELIKKYQRENLFPIIYKKQVNQGKMQAINHLLPLVKEDIIVEMDSDDYFLEHALETICKAYQTLPEENNLYGVVFYKLLTGHPIKKMQELEGKTVTLFDIHYKYGYEYDMAITFKADIRKKYPYELEKEERFITEARTYHKMDAATDGLYIYGKDIMVCEYQLDGYTSNIKKMFTRYPYGYYQYFLELLNYKHHGILFKKRLYLVKHYILFSTLTKTGFLKSIKCVNGIYNKFLITILYLPGKFMTVRKMGSI